MLFVGCSDDSLRPQQDSADTDPMTLKAQPPSHDWAGRARPFARDLRVSDLAATPTRLFATTLGRDEKLVAVSEQGQIATFSFDFTAPPDAHCYVDVSPGWNPQFPADEVWVSRGPELVRLSPQGDQMTTIATVPADHGDIAGLCFDDVGSFGYALLVLTDTGDVYSLSAAGSVLQHKVSLGPGGCAPHVARLEFGAHGGQLLVSFPGEDVVRAVSPNGVLSTVVGWSGASAAVTVPGVVMEYGRSRGAYFVALEDGTVHRFERGDIAALAGELLVSSLYRSGSGVVTHQGAGYSTRAFSRFWGPEVVTALVRRPAVTEIEVTLQPGTPQPTFVHGSVTLVPAALLSSAWFQPDQVDVGAVTLAGASPVPFGKSGVGTWVDLNDDGIVDLTLYFRPADMQVDVGHIVLPLLGRTMDTEAFRGSAPVTVTAP